jgi:hypothetical protein
VDILCIHGREWDFKFFIIFCELQRATVYVETINAPLLPMCCIGHETTDNINAEV